MASMDSASMSSGQQSLDEETPNLQDIICTNENWELFFHFQIRDFKRELIPTTAKTFENYNSAESKALVLTKTDPGGSVELSICSPYLQSKFREVVKIENYQGIVVLAEEILLYQPFIPLYFHIDEMMVNVEKDIGVIQKNMDDMKALLHFVRKGWPSKVYQNVNRQITEGLITHADLWALFNPGQLAVRENAFGDLELLKIRSIRLTSAGNPRQSDWAITTGQIGWNGVDFVEHYETVLIRHFPESKRVQDLEIYPLSRCSNISTLKDKALACGKEYCQLHVGTPKVMSYDGPALPVLFPQKMEPPPNLNSGFSGKSRFKLLKLFTTIIFDPDGVAKTMVAADLGKKRIDNNTIMRSHKPYNDRVVVDFSDEDYIICSKTSIFYSPEDDEWYMGIVSMLEEKVWRPETFQRLVLEQSQKERLRKLAQTNSSRLSMAKTQDVVKGKGIGTVFLLYGPPGVGKTVRPRETLWDLADNWQLTAEVLSEITQRPLLKVNLGKIADHQKWEQCIETVFFNAESWNAILLIDEAEIVLEKRTYERLTQNAWISVFLRKLEYFKGLIILTTNMVDCIDDAFESRISCPVHFPGLSRENREKIWSGFIESMDMLAAHKSSLLKKIPQWSQEKLNGRQIRNVVMMAESLAASDEDHPWVTIQHVEEMLNITVEFSAYNERGSLRMKQDYFSGPKY